MTEKRLKELIFSKWYVKLNEGFFPTIRRRKQCKVGEKVVVIIKGVEEANFFAKCLEIIPLEMIYFTDEFLMYDTGTKTRKEALELINSFYKKPILEDDRMYLHLFVKVIGDD